MDDSEHLPRNWTLKDLRERDPLAYESLIDKIRSAAANAQKKLKNKYPKVVITRK